METVSSLCHLDSFKRDRGSRGRHEVYPMLELCVMQSPRLGERRLLTLLPPLIDDALRVYDIRDPVDGLGHAMIDTRLTRLRAGITG